MRRLVFLLAVTIFAEVPHYFHLQLPFYFSVFILKLQLQDQKLSFCLFVFNPTLSKQKMSWEGGGDWAPVEALAL